MIKVFPDEKILAKNLALEILKELKKRKTCIRLVQEDVH